MAGNHAKPIYVICGSDRYLRDKCRAETMIEALGGSDPQTCVTCYDASAELADVLDDLRTLPFLSDRRLVIVDEADAFVSANRQALEKYAANPSPTGALLLLVKSFPGTTRLAKLVAKVGVTLRCDRPTGRKLNSFVRDRAQALGRQIEPPAAELIVQWFGGDLARIDSELNKLALYTEGRQRITAEDVSAMAAAAGNATPWDLTNAIAAGHAAAALKALAGLLTKPGEEYRVLGLLGWHLRRVLKARRGSQKIARDFRQLIRTDLAMKTGRDGKAALQRLVVALC